MRKKILLIEDDELFQQAVADYLNDRYEILTADCYSKAEEILSKKIPDLVLLDILLPEIDGIEILKRIKSSLPDLPVIMLTAVDKIPKVVESIKLGAFDYIAKQPTSLPMELTLSIDRALEASEMKQELKQRRDLQLVTNKEFELVGNSPGMQAVKNQIKVLGKSDSVVLIQGETGTGKELVAHQIHSCSARDSRPFVAINCGAIPKDLIESDLFGYKKGAFTGAKDNEIGKFELAHRGTILLDEIGEMPQYAQIKLLRVLEEREFYPVGSTELKKVDVRIIAATNMNLQEMVDRGQFRPDLFYRLNVCTIYIPPLRERQDDILLLAHHFMEKFNRKFRKNFQELSLEAQELLLLHHWKGNVRELCNLLERIMLFEEDTVIHKKHLLLSGFAGGGTVSPTPPAGVPLPDQGLDHELERLEKELLKKALESTRWNKTQAAKLLKVSPPTFYYRLEKYGLE